MYEIIFFNTGTMQCYQLNKDDKPIALFEPEINSEQAKEILNVLNGKVLVKDFAIISNIAKNMSHASEQLLKLIK